MKNVKSIYDAYYLDGISVVSFSVENVYIIIFDNNSFSVIYCLPFYYANCFLKLHK